MVNFEENYERLRDNVKDEREASLLLTKIRSELSDSENYLLNTKCSWQEHFLNSEIYSNGKHINYDRIKYSSNFGNSFNKLVNLSTTYRVSPYVKQFLPIRIFAFDDNKYICNVYSVLWDVYTNKAKRKILFNANGEIFLEKEGNNIMYKILYDLKDDTYDFNIFKDSINLRLKKNDNYITKRYSLTEYTYDIKNGSKNINVTDNLSHSDHTSSYDLYYDEDNKLYLANVKINLFSKKNDKIKNNGMFIIEMSDHHIKPLYISNKGVKVNLKDDPKLSLNLSRIIYTDYDEACTKYENKPNIDNYIIKHTLEKVIDSFGFINLDDEYMSSELVDKLDKVDSTISTFFGEIPFNTLTDLMKCDIRTSRAKKKRRSKKLVR